MNEQNLNHEEENKTFTGNGDISRTTIYLNRLKNPKVEDSQSEKRKLPPRRFFKDDSTLQK